MNYYIINIMCLFEITNQIFTHKSKKYILLKNSDSSDVLSQLDPKLYIFVFVFFL